MAIAAACGQWPLTRSLFARRQDRDKIRVYTHGLLKGQRVHFKYLPPQLEGDLGFGADGRPNVSFFTYELSLTDFLESLSHASLNLDMEWPTRNRGLLTRFPRLQRLSNWNIMSAAFRVQALASGSAPAGMSTRCISIVSLTSSSWWRAKSAFVFFLRIFRRP